MTDHPTNSSDDPIRRIVGKPVSQLTKEEWATFAAELTQRAHPEAPPVNGVNWSGSTKQGANLAGASLNGATLVGVDFGKDGKTATTFAGANASGAAFFGATLDGADFTGAWAMGSSFVSCSARKANFKNAHLAGSNFAGADLTGADFTGATLDGVSFANALVDGTVFSGVNAQFREYRCWTRATPQDPWTLSANDLRIARITGKYAILVFGTTASRLAMQGSMVVWGTDITNPMEYGGSIVAGEYACGQVTFETGQGGSIYWPDGTQWGGTFYGMVRTPESPTVPLWFRGALI